MVRFPFRELFRKFYGAIESLGIPYFAYGGVVVAAWGNPRETEDVDAVIVVSEDECGNVIRSLQSAGFESPQDAALFAIDGFVRLRLRGRHADLALGRTPFDQSALSRRRRITLFDLPVWVASPEDLVIYKLIAHRYKDLADAQSVLTRRKDELELAYLRRWADEIAAHTGKFEVPQKLEDLLRRI